MLKEGKITIYTDGACVPNPGSGGWCTIIFDGFIGKIYSGGEDSTTNNRMELEAVLFGMDMTVHSEKEVEIFCDNTYVTDMLSKWIYGWYKKKKRLEKKANLDLVGRGWGLLRKKKYKFTWVRGHNGDYLNELCDEIAVREVERQLGNKQKDEFSLQMQHMRSIAQDQ
jgi:ribonuclease HI